MPEVPSPTLRDEKRRQKSVGIEKMSATSACRLRSMNRWRALVPLTNLAWRSASGAPGPANVPAPAPTFAETEAAKNIQKNYRMYLAEAPAPSSHY